MSTTSPLTQGSARQKLRTLSSIACVCVVWVTLAPAAQAQQDFSCKTQINNFRVLGNVPGADSVTVFNAMIACTDSADSASRAISLRRLGPEAVRLAKMFFDIPEYHDEGRLLAGFDAQGSFLGPMAGVYASPFLQGFTRPSQIYEQGLPGTLAGIVVVDAPTGATLPTTYQHLQLQGGVNCIWLYVNPPGPLESIPSYLANLHYSARVSHPADGAACNRSAPMGPPLPVVAVQITEFRGDGDYPGVARFETDRLNNLTIGLRCLNAFCEIGINAPLNVRTPDGLLRPNPNVAQWHPPGITTAEQRRRVSIKAWNDEQFLAVRDAGYMWRPTKVRARISPAPAAALYDSADFHDQWRRVATISIAGNVPGSSKYYRWGLRQGDNHVEFRYAASAGAWQARLVRAADNAIIPWRVMTRTVHHDLTVPPIVRFRWTGADDGVWAPCGNACCKASDDGV